MSAAPGSCQDSSWTTLIGWFRRSLDALVPDVPVHQIEAWAIDVFTAMGGPLRRFHSLDHLFRFSPRDPLETLAVLYHDVVYWSVDRCWPTGYAAVLDAVAASGKPGEPLALEAPIPHYDEILEIFGLSPGSGLPKVGGNELMSALAFASALGATLGRESTLAVAACIEATIPFRGPQARRDLARRLGALGLPARFVDESMVRAVRIANQDVGDFCHEDPGTFLGGTWNLLPELNPDLRISAVFGIGAYRRALEAMDRFFAFLTPDVLFDSWGDEPETAVLHKWKAQAAVNLKIAREYLGAKLLATALLEAFALETGPDVPLSMFMGAAADSSECRLEAHLPVIAHSPEVDPVFFLLEWGRSTEASFDLTNSPLAAWIYRQLDGSRRSEEQDRARAFFEGRIGPREYLAGSPMGLVRGVGEALARFVPTRTEALEGLLSVL